MLRNSIKTRLNRFGALALCLGTLLSFSVPASASDTACDMDEIINRNAEYVAENFEALIDSALENAASDVSPYSETNLASDSGDADFTSEEYVLQDAELLDSDGTGTGIYALTTGVVLRASTGGNRYDEAYDTTVSIKGYSTIYYNKTTSAGITYYCLTKVSGGYTVVDSSAQVSSQSVVYGMSGLNYSQGAVQKSGTYTPTSKSWSKSTGYTDYVCPTPYNLIGATYKITLKRNGGSSWTYSLTNSL